MEYIERIVNGETNEIIEKPYSKKQLDELKEMQLKSAELQAELDAKASAKAALLDRLGITEDEAKLLLA